ncbi:pyrroline-5-carboxylate reductase dimerization domain-containing protein [Brucella sp. BE17]|uniref:pyrroline-5-carboxylate reductase family protein n=1 Tax=Brucella sp. BE17 TaxID=3142977 RepID=UPI0031BA5795
MSTSLKIGIAGGSGWLGGAIASAILDTGTIKPAGLAMSYRSRRPHHFADCYWTSDNQELADRCDIIILAVRPHDWLSLEIKAPDKLLISVMAGITLDRLKERHQTHRIIRAMPNAAASVRQSYTPWVGSSKVTPEDRSITRTIFAACGQQDEIGAENHLDYLTGLCGSGPALPALLGCAMIDGAVNYGIQPDIALRAVTAVLVGTGCLLQQKAQTPQEIVASFTSYDGTTTAALQAMNEAQFYRCIAAGLSAALLKAANMESTA